MAAMDGEQRGVVEHGASPGGFVHACLPFAARKASMGVMRIVADPPSDAGARRRALGFAA
jgi:hypothetical protein